MDENSWMTQVINRDGKFDEGGLEHFLNNSGFADCGGSYAVVSIMGPQSSGKSTLCNELFRTEFQVMDANNGRSKTTEGIWIASGSSNTEPFTIVMDLEGTDGRERGEDDTTFEEQSALFALAIADIVVINMWCHDLGREQAANRPLLKIAFQAMLRMFKNPRKTMLLFVLRDKTKTPLEFLEAMLRADIQQMWNEVASSVQESTSLSEFFNVEVTALSNYETEVNHFKEEVSQLRQWFFHSISPRGLAGDRKAASLASAFSRSIQQTWQTIKENKDLDLPVHKVLVANIRCDEIANDVLQHFRSDEAWIALEEAARVGTAPDFGKKFRSIRDKYLYIYDQQVIYFDEGAQGAKRQLLLSRMSDVVRPACVMMLQHWSSEIVQDLKAKLEHSVNNGAEGFAACVLSCVLEFDKECKDLVGEGPSASSDPMVDLARWDSKIREKLCHDIAAQGSCQLTKQLAEALVEPVKSMLDVGGESTWPSIRRLLAHKAEITVSQFSSGIASLELDEATIATMLQNIRGSARNVVEIVAREKAATVLKSMKDRFSGGFNRDIHSIKTVQDIREIAKKSRSMALELLSVMAAIRLEEKQDNIKSILFSSLMDGAAIGPFSQSRNEGDHAWDPLALTLWEKVSTTDTLITPTQCKKLWKKFRGETEPVVARAVLIQLLSSEEEETRWQYSVVVGQVAMAIAITMVVICAMI